MTDETARDMLVSLFNRESKAKILGFMLDHPDEHYQQHEIADAIGISQPAVSRESGTFVEQDLLADDGPWGALRLKDNERTRALREFVEAMSEPVSDSQGDEDTED